MGEKGNSPAEQGAGTGAAPGSATAPPNLAVPAGVDPAKWKAFIDSGGAASLTFDQNGNPILSPAAMAALR